MFNKTILDNGIKVLTEEINEFKSASIGIWVHTGPQNESPQINGISHFVEHMMFKGTQKRTATDIAELMDSVGGQLNAFTEKEQTCYYARVVDRHIPLALDVLSDMFVNSLFDPDEINRERKVILEEIHMYEDDPEDMVFEEFNNTLWDNHPLSSPTLGRVETVGKFNRDDFMNYLENFYTPDNVTIAAAGHFKHDEFIKMIREHFSHLKGRVKKQKLSKPRSYVRKKLRHKDCEQIYICMGGPGISQRDKRKFTFFVLDSIVGGSMSSRLFQEIREKRGLVYTVSTFTNSYCNSAQFGVYACTSRENLEEVMKISDEILDDIYENGVTEKEITRSKEHIKGAISLGLESTSNRMIRLNKSELYHNRLIPIEEVIQKVEQVNLEKVNELAKDLLDRKKYSLSVLGPLDEEIKKLLGE